MSGNMREAERVQGETQSRPQERRRQVPSRLLPDRRNKQTQKEKQVVGRDSETDSGAGVQSKQLAQLLNSMRMDSISTLGYSFCLSVD